MEQVIEIIMGEKDISELDGIQNNSDKFIRWKNVLLLFIKQSKLNLQKGFSRDHIQFAVNKFDDFFSENSILTQYINGENLDIGYVEKQIMYFYDIVVKELGINIESNVSSQNFDDLVTEHSSSVEHSKVLTKSNGHSLLEKENKSKGYVGAFLMASLTAAIEIATVAYILLNGM